MPTGATERRVYTSEFKAAAVELHRGGRSLEEVCGALDVPEALLRTWVLQSEVQYAGQPRPVHAAPAPVTPPMPALTVKHCMVCGRGPALDVALRSVTGIVIAFRMRRIKGTFCRDCGTAMSRRVLDRTLLTGWWGLFAGIANLYAAIVDSSALGRFKRAPEPVGEPKAEPLKAGGSMFRRGGVYVGGVVMVFSLFVGLAVVGSTADASRFDGKCIAFDPHKVIAKPSCDSSHDGRVIGVVGDRDLCPSPTDATMRLKADDAKVLCVDLDQ